jgi:hypothetical protein
VCGGGVQDFRLGNKLVPDIAQFTNQKATVPCFLFLLFLVCLCVCVISFFCFQVFVINSRGRGLSLTPTFVFSFLGCCYEKKKQLTEKVDEGNVIVIRR